MQCLNVILIPNIPPEMLNYWCCIFFSVRLFHMKPDLPKWTPGYVKRLFCSCWTGHESGGKRRVSIGRWREFHSLLGGTAAEAQGSSVKTWLLGGDNFFFSLHFGTLLMANFFLSFNSWIKIVRRRQLASDSFPRPSHRLKCEAFIIGWNLKHHDLRLTISLANSVTEWENYIITKSFLSVWSCLEYCIQKLLQRKALC